MPRQRLKQVSNFKILHQTKGRVRFYHPDLTKTVDAKKLESEILDIDGVVSARVNLAIKSITVLYSCDDFNQIISAISNLEFSLKPQSQSVSKAEILKAGSALAMTPLISNKKAKTALTLAATYPLLSNGVKELFRSGLNSKVLEAVAVGISLARRDFTAANSANLMIEIGEYIEETTVYKSDELIKELAKPTVKEAWIEVTKNGKKELIKKQTDEIKVGDIVVVGSGETIAVDGHIIDGEANINQASMTGESEPIKKSHGQKVMSGTVVEEGKIKIWAELTGKDTSTERIKKYIESSLSQKSAIGEKTSQLADKLVPVTLGLAGVSYLINKTAQSIASVLQIDYSCALKLTTPVAFKSTISKAGKSGILVKGAKSLEELSKADTFVFDKTGTLTEGVLKVVDIVSFDDAWDKKSLLNLVASTEEHYFHPIAEAVVIAANEMGFTHVDHGEVEFIVAHGLKTNFNNKEVLIGSRHFLEDDNSISFEKYKNVISCEIDNGNTLLYVAYDNNLIGIIIMEDEIRSNAKKTISRLKALGVKQTIMLTGDIDSKAQSVAKELGIDTVFSQLLPTDKAKIIEQLKAEGKNVVFCGDGINDAPSLTKANVGISMKRGADIAKAAADISLLKNDIYTVAQIKEYADKTMSLVDRNFKATIGINSAILLLATLGKLNPSLTAVLHNGTTIGLLLNSMKGVKLNLS